MYRVMILDDEALIVNGLTDFITKSGSEQYELFPCYTGAQALALLQKRRFDVVITDIEMQGYNGLQLHDMIQLNYPECRTIFLTAHSNFDYAYRSTQYKNTSFLLKSEGYARVLSMLDETVAEIARELLNSQLMERAAASRSETLLLRQSLYLNRCVTNLCPELETLSQGFACYELPLNVYLPVRPALLRLTLDAPLSRQTSALTEVTRYLEYQLGQYGNVRVFETGELDAVCLIQAGDNDERLMNRIELLHGAAERLCGGEIALVLGSRPLGWADGFAQLEVMRAMLDGNQLGYSYITRISEKQERLDDVARLEYRLSHAVRTGDSAAIDDPLRQLYALCDAKEAQNVLLRALGGARFPEGELPEKRLAETTNLQSASKLLSDTIKARQSDQTRLAGDRLSGIVKQIDALIDRRYMEDLSLSDIAEALYMSPAYISRLYKKQQGINVVDRIRTVRMEQAKRLLAETNLKVQKIAQDVGFRSARYFTASFHSYCGEAPNTWRERAWAQNGTLPRENGDKPDE
jgi:two-component system, response regulator YesN